MKSTARVTVSFVAVLLAIVSYGARPQDSGDQATTPRPSRLLEFLPVGAVADLSFSDGSCQVVLLNESQVRDRFDQVKQLVKEIEEAAETDDADSRSQREERLQRAEVELSRIQSPWKVVDVGEDFVQLEPVKRLPLREDTLWVVLPESSIRLIKARN